MANRVLSIEIGNSLTHICEMDYKGKTHKVYNTFSVRTPANVLQDGVLHSPGEFAQTLISRLAEQRIKTRDCIFTISSTRIAAREVQIPNVKGNKIDSVVKTNASDYFPVDLSQYEIGCHMIGKGEPDETGKIKVMALAVPKNLLDSYYEFASECGLNIVSFDYASNSIYQILKNECGEDVTMVLKVDETNTSATILNNGQIAMQRTVSYGVEEAIQFMAASKLFGNLDYGSATSMLRHRKCINKTLNPADLEWDLSTEEEEDDDDDRVKALKGKITGSLANLISSIGRVIDYYNSRNPDAPIKNVYLTGVGGDFLGIGKLFTNCLEIRVTSLSSVEGISVGKKLQGSSFGRYIACMGAVIAPVGLIDKDNQKTTNVTLVKGTNYTFVSVAVLVLCLVITGALCYISVTRYTAAKAENTMLNGRLAQLQEAQNIYNDYTAATNQYDKYRYYYWYTENPNEQLVEFINELETILPSSFYTESFTSDEVGISMSVTVEGKAAAARTIKNIREMESIENVDVSGIHEEVNDLGESSVTFSISGTYKPIPMDKEEDQAQNPAQAAQ